MLLGPIQATAVYWGPLYNEILVFFVLFENDITIVGCYQKIVPSIKHSLVLMCV